MKIRHWWIVSSYLYFPFYLSILKDDKIIFLKQKNTTWCIKIVFYIFPTDYLFKRPFLVCQMTFKRVHSWNWCGGLLVNIKMWYGVIIRQIWNLYSGRIFTLFTHPPITFKHDGGVPQTNLRLKLTRNGPNYLSVKKNPSGQWDEGHGVVHHA